MAFKVSPLKEKNATPQAASSEKPSSSRILILAESRAGLGDLLFSLKISSILTASSSVDCAILCNKDLDIEKISKVAGKVLQVPIYSEENIPPSFTKGANLYIGAATCTKRDELCFLSAFPLDPKIPYIGLSEYNVFPKACSYENPEDKEYVLGLGPKCLGIFLDKELQGYYHSKANKEQREGKIAALPTAIKGSILEGKSAAAYAATSKLYMGYSYYLESAIHFLMLVAQKESTSVYTTIDVVIPGKKRRKENGKTSLISDFFKQPDLFQPQHFKKSGFSEIRCNGSVIKLSEEPGKILHIHNPEMLEKEDFKTCLMASDPCMLVTGDQSLSEAISAGKVIMYEELAHKEALLHAFCEEGSKYGLSKILSLLAFRECEENSTRHFEKILTTLSDPEFESNYTHFIEHLHDTHDASTKICAIVSSALYRT